MFFCLDTKEPKNQEQMTLNVASKAGMGLLLYAICSALLLDGLSTGFPSFQGGARGGCWFFDEVMKNCLSTLFSVLNCVTLYFTINKSQDYSL